MSIFNKAKSYASDQVRESLSGARDRARSEVNQAKNRLSGFLGLDSNHSKFRTAKSEPLFYPLQNVTDDPTGDRTVFWLQIEAIEQKTRAALSTVQSATGSGSLDNTFRTANEGITTKTIWLYLPNMTQSDSVNVNDTNIGVAGAVAAGAIQAGGVGQIVSAAGQSVDQLASTVSSIRSGAPPSVGTIATAIGFAKDIPIVNRATNAVSYATGITKNPHTISLFEGVQLRSHEFEFNFAPRNAAEARQVEAIVKFFRLAMYPHSLTGAEAFGDSLGSDVEVTEGSGDGATTRSLTDEELGADVSLAFIHPNTFKLTALRMDKSGELVNLASKGLFYKESILTSCTVNYDPSGSMSQRPDGSFPSTSMSLSFVEVETLDRNQIRQLYR